MQNEVIEVLKDVVLDEAVGDINTADVGFFTLKADGTRDPTNTENISVVIRFVKEGAVHETLVDMPSSQELDAESITTALLKSLRQCNIDPNKMLSQCYDGASVMSGKNGGVQRKLQEKLNKTIPYVHCFNHQLHLAVVHAIGENPDIERFFGVCNRVYNFARHPTLTALYEGSKLQRLLEQRWSGHFESTLRIIENHNSLIDLFQHSRGSSNADICVDAEGLLQQIREKKFLFIAYMVYNILLKLRPADKLLQDRTCDLTTGIQLINSSIESIQNMRSDIDETFLSISSDLHKHQTVETREKRCHKLPARLQNSVVLSSVGQTSEPDQPEQLRRLLIEVLDSCLGELNSRFSERNCRLVCSISRLQPHRPDF